MKKVITEVYKITHTCQPPPHPVTYYIGLLTIGDYVLLAAISRSLVVEMQLLHENFGDCESLLFIQHVEKQLSGTQ